MQSTEFKFSSFVFEEEGHTPVIKREVKNEVVQPATQKKQYQEQQESTDNSGWVQIGNKRRRKNPK
jgi:hypothetical protein